MRYIPLFSLFALALQGSVAFGAEQISERVFLIRDKPGSMTRFQMVVNAGCLDEAEGQCRGLAHYLEHVLLVGRNPDHKDIAVRMFGEGTSNGWTSMRGTVYINNTPARAEGPRKDLETVFGFYAARLKDFSMSEQEAARERNVVLQEHDWRVQSNPYLLAWRDLQRKALPDHPFGQWTIGTREAIQGFTIEQARAYHRNWYHINNVQFLVAGDIDPALLKEISEKALAGLQPATLPERNFAKRPDLSGPERQEFAIKGAEYRNSGAQVIKVVRVAEPDRNRIRAMRVILENFLNSELPGSPKLVLAEAGAIGSESAVRIWLERAAPETFLIGIGANSAAGATPERTRDAVVAYLGAPGRDDVLTDAVVERIKGRIIRNRAEMANIPGREYGQLIQWLANRNTYEEWLAWPGVLEGIRPEDVRAFARSFAGPGRLVTQTIETAEKTQ